jgi:hypothetical protein
MKKTLHHLSTAPAVTFRPFAFAPPKPAHFTLLLKLHREQSGEPRKIPVEHFPSPPCPILLKIVAMETYSANVPRLNRRRQFCTRIRPL